MADLEYSSPDAPVYAVDAPLRYVGPVEEEDPLEEGDALLLDDDVGAVLLESGDRILVEV